jgi:predicted aldo/keto reductase-like oxidoreductase
METVRHGRTNLEVTRLGWGGIPIQRISEDEAVGVVKAVIAMGVDLLDTARGYTTSEHRIGLALKQAGRRVVLSTKSFERTARIYEDVLESLKALDVGRIDIYNLHDVSSMGDYEKVIAGEGAYVGLTRARHEGLIDHIGLSSHNLDVLERVLSDGFFDVIMTCYSFLEPDAESRIFPKARSKDIGVMAMKPFSGGVIEHAGTALRYVLSAPDIVPIPGSETVRKAKENWDVFAGGNHALTEEDKARIEAVKREFSRQFCRRCDYCQPCTQQIPIQVVLGMKTVLKRLGPQSREAGWVRGVIEKARECTECGECLPRCPYDLPIPDLIKENLAYYDAFQYE